MLTARALFLTSRAEQARPGVVLVGVGAKSGEDQWDIDGEFVRRRELAGVIAGAAVEAEVREVDDVGSGLKVRRSSIAGKTAQ